MDVRKLSALKNVDNFVSSMFYEPQSLLNGWSLVPVIVLSRLNATTYGKEKQEKNVLLLTHCGKYVFSCQ